MEHNLLTYPTWEKYTVLAKVISSLSIRDRRQIFQICRQNSAAFCCDLFLPQFGFTVGEFAVWHTLGENRRKSRRSELQE